MLDLAFRDLSFPRLGSGRGADTTAPVASSVSYDTGTDTLTMAVSEACTLYALHNASATPLSAAAIQSGAEVTQALAAGIGYISWDDATWGAGTWYLHLCIKDAAGNATVINPIQHVIPIPGFTETWSSYTAGDTWTQIDVAYTRNTSGIAPTIVADADSPSGKGLSLIGSTANERWISRDDISAALAVRTTERVNWLTKIKLGSAANARSAMGFMDGSSLNTGACISRGGVAGTWDIACQLAGNVSTKTSVTNILTGLADGAIYWIRGEIDGLDVKVRVWADGSGEPSGWNTAGQSATRTAGAAITIDSLDLTIRTAATMWTCLGYSIAIGADAASF